MSRRVMLGLGTSIAAVALAAGCASRTAAPPSPTGQPGQPSITVVLREFEFEPRPLKAKAGKVRFLLLNRGTVDHDFMIPSVMGAMEHEKDLVKPGRSKTIEIELKPGTYEVICTIPGHQDAGMKVQLEVSS